MDSKFYISYKAAKLLKEKGYNEECDTTIDDDGDLFKEKYLLNQDLPKWRWSCPTKAEAIDWLESRGITIEAFSARIGENRKWCYSIINTKTDITIETPYKFSTRLEAEEAAIIKALELL